jgi:hypothetical protein
MLLWSVEAQVSYSRSMRQRSGRQNGSSSRNICGQIYVRNVLIRIAEPEAAFREAHVPIAFYPTLPSIPATKHRDPSLRTTTTLSLRSTEYTTTSHPEDIILRYHRSSQRNYSRPTSTAFIHYGRSSTSPSMLHSTMRLLQT